MSCSNPSCTKCRSLYDEMLVLKSQLVEAKTKLESNRRSPPRSAPANQQQPLGHEVGGFAAAPPTPPAGSDSLKLQLTNSNPSGFPFRYVPPHEFLPAPFVEAHIDWLLILDRYAQMFHSHHVAQPMVSMSDPVVLQSTITLLQLKVRQQQEQLSAAVGALEAAQAEIARTKSGATAGRGSQDDDGNPNMDSAPLFTQDEFASMHKNMRQPGKDDSHNSQQQQPPRRHHRHRMTSSRNDNNNNPVDDDDDDAEYDGDEPNSPSGTAAGTALPPNRNARIERFRQQKRAQTPPAGSSRRGSASAATDPHHQVQTQGQAPPSSTGTRAPPHIAEQRRNSATGGASDANNTPSNRQKPPTMAWNNIMSSPPETAAAAAAGGGDGDDADKKEQQQGGSSSDAVAQQQHKDDANQEATKAKAEQQSAAAAAPAVVGELPLPPEWAEQKDPRSGRTYFYNKKTKETSWKRPVNEEAAAEAEAAAAAAQVARLRVM